MTSDEGSAANRSHAPFLAHLKQELFAPIDAILEFSRMLLQDAVDRGQEPLQADLQRIQEAGRKLAVMVHELLDQSVTKTSFSDPALRSKIRHDLRTPLTHILGYCELLLEDSEEQFLASFVPDLRRIHAAGEQLLAQIDDLLNFGNALERPNLDHLTPETFKERAGDGKTTCPGRILVVDDNATNRDLFVRRLEREGHDAQSAEHGRRALERLQREEFDLILLDILMPEMNGVEVLERIKADERLRHLPVIMVSGLEGIEYIVHCIKHGAEDYLPKPCDPVLLKARIDACLEKKRLRDREVLYLQQIEEERTKTNELLRVILPDEIIDELKRTDRVTPRRHENVAVLFADIVGFTPYCDKHAPEQVVNELQQLIVAWEKIAAAHEVEKIKTIGDAFMAAAGLLRPVANPVLNCVRCGLEMQSALAEMNLPWQVRIGIHAGPVIAGVLGRRKYLYDLWGDAVNTAARMESHGLPGEITLSGAAFSQIADQASGDSIGRVEVKGKGPMELIRFHSFHPPVA